MAEIVIPIEASKQIKMAAQSLQQYIFKSSKALLPITTINKNKKGSIHVGLTSFVQNSNLPIENLDEDGFILQSIGNNFIILGGGDWGTEFGVYEFLEMFLGIHWLMPTDLGIDIPKRSTILLPDFNKTFSPVYISRQISPINILGNNDLDSWGRIQKLRGRIKFHHNLNKLFDPKEFWASRPDFYSSAIETNKDFRRVQPNFSAPGIVDSATKKIIKYFIDNPKESSYSLGINDSDKFDQSPSSKKRRIGLKNYLGFEDVSDDYFKWANEVVHNVTKIFPDKKFGLLAYNNVAEPPSKEVGINSDIVPFITYERMRWADSTLQKEGHDLNEKWAEESSSLGWYDYAYGSNYLLPRVWFHEMQNYLKWGSQHNVKYYYAELYPNWGTGPKPWVQAKLLWNPDYDVDSLLNVWYVSFAGVKAAPKLKAFYSIWEGFWTKDIFASKWNTNKGQYLPKRNYAYLDAVPKEYILKSDELIAESYNLAGTQLQKDRVKVIGDMWQIYKTAIILWQQSTLSYNGKLKKLTNSNQFIYLLNQLQNDPIHSASILKIKTFLKIK